MSNDLIEKRDERTKRRKEFKKKVDKIYNLSYKDDEKMTLSANRVMKLSDPTVRLLDEGAVVGDDYIDFIIKKGTLAKFMAGDNEILPNIDPSETYTVNLGHMDFATFPILLGEWKKSDLTLVAIGDERNGIDVEVHLDEENPLVQQLKRQPYDVGVSAEFYYHVDWETTFEIGILVIDEVSIFAYGIVGECGNVNSSGLELKGDIKSMEDNKDIMENAIVETEVDEAELGVEEVSIPESIEEEVEAEEEVSEEAEEDEDEAEIAEEAAEAEESESEEVEAEEAEDSDEGEDDEAEDELVQALAVMNDLKDQVQTLSDKLKELEEVNASLKKTNKRLSNKLQKENERKEQFKKDIKGLSVELLPDEEKKEKEDKVIVTDREYIRSGIGEI